MCTTVALMMDRFFFGRNMDLEGSFGERVTVTPRNFPFSFHHTKPSLSHYAMIGMATVIDGYPLYADAVNEKGLCMAGLNFPNNAYYQEVADTENIRVAPFELIPLVLGSCANLSEARALLEKVELVSEPFSETVSLTPLHWHVADSNGSLVVEPRKEGLMLYENPVGVLTNNPPFPRQLEILAKYDSLGNQNPADGSPNESAYSLGLGGIGLPGDYSSSSRFVKAVFLRGHLLSGNEKVEQIAQVFSLLAAVAPIKGSVLNEEARPHYATYSCCMDTAKGIYYVRRAEWLSVSAFYLQGANTDGTTLFVYN